MNLSVIQKTIQERQIPQHDSPLIKMEMYTKVLRNGKAKWCLIILLLVSILGIIGPWIAPYDPTTSDYEALLQPPSAKYLLGTDDIGRDLLSRMLYGTRVTLMVAVLAVGITFILGTFIGVVSAYTGGFIDQVLMRIMDIMLALPGIVLALAIVAVLGPSQTNAMIAIGISLVPGFSRVIRAAALTVKSAGYVEASRAIGSSNLWIIFFQFLPNVTNVLIVYTTLFVGIAILDTAALGFIGLGAQPPTPEWGTMLSDGKEYLTDGWWLTTFPGLAITIVVFSVNMLGDALRDIFDPRSNLN